ncbi:hypothetical protein HELRODRAFT_161592 [Helobdella robusta]|uniref:Spt6 SH2 domain-containing protein n=1 Tax=Helobdella robusta TaxID=6412 RepID=T1ERN9_HELRO|nr:hypothetical protein HELRODRAFT_161592 [Helobdella robusta]ESO02336.1 hypothetical protein HELRODRAFT_161592 [Helobdella robusta]
MPIKHVTFRHNRIISHPSYCNVDYLNCKKLMENFERGDVIIRPGSKGNDHLTVTWKVSNGVFWYIDVKEEGKANAELAVNLLDNKEVIEKDLMEERKSNSSRFPYYFTISKQYTGKFMFSYFPNRSVKHEYVTVTRDGLRYRGQIFSNINNLVNWSKLHFNDATIANQLLNPVTSQAQSTGSTGYNTHSSGSTGYHANPSRSTKYNSH